MKEERTCICCKCKTNKTNLLRIVNYHNQIEIDEKQNKKGRGAYICNNEKCLNELIQKKLLNRAFKQKINDKVYDLIKNLR